MSFKIITHSPTQTKKLGETFAKQILKSPLREYAFVIGLIGDLGSGKTTFLQGFAKGLGIRNKILSPTFVIFKKFKLKSLRFRVFYHIDCYRIEKPKELLALGFADMCQNPENIVVIEWADRVKKILPEQVLIMKFRFVDKDKREIGIGQYPLVDNLPLTRFCNALKLK